MRYPISIKTIIKTITALVWGGLVLVVFTSPALADADPQVDDESYIVDERGRPMRVVFPLHDRLAIDGFVAGSTHRGTSPSPVRAGMRLTLEHSFGLDYPDEEIWWRFRHRWFSAVASRAGESYVLGTTLLEGSYLRHDKSAFVVVPGADHLRFPAPFDIAFEYSFLDVDFDLDATSFSTIDVAQFAFLLDFLRDPQFRHRFAVGPAMGYGMWRHDLDDDGWIHSFVPVTGGRLIYGWQSATGRLAADTRIQCAAEAALLNRELSWQRRCTADARAEWTVLAINDRPLNLFFEGSAGESRQQLDTDDALIWNAKIGLRFSLPGNAP